MSSVRAATAAGGFYPKDKKKLKEMLGRWLDGTGEQTAPQAIVVPHSKYELSGATAALAYRQISPPDIAVLFCSAHSGKGKASHLWSHGSWSTPLGKVKVAEKFAANFAAAWKVSEETKPHEKEHGIEVQLPFLQFLNPRTEIVPVLVGRLSFEGCVRLGEALDEVTRETEKNGKSVLWVASTDLSHQLPAKAAKEKDRMALKAMEAVDASMLFELANSEDMSICGLSGTTAILSACQARGNSTAELLGYTHSGEVSGDDRSVVGYAALCI